MLLTTPSTRPSRRALLRSSGCLAALVVLALLLAPAMPSASAVSATGTVIVRVDEPSGSFASGFCASPGQPVLFSFTCSDGNPARVDVLTIGTPLAVTLPAGTYTTAIADISNGTLAPIATITLTAGQTLTCTYTRTTAPACTTEPAPATGTVVVQVGETSGSYASGFCASPGQPVLLSFTCSNGTPARVDFLTLGTPLAVTLPAGTYTTAIAEISTIATATLGPIATITVTAGQTLTCTYTRTTAPACTSSVDTDADGVADSIDVGDGAFSDGTTAAEMGRITDDGGLSVAVSDVPGPEVRVVVGAGTGTANLTVCGFTVLLAAGSDTRLSCGSVIVAPVSGPPARVVLNGGTVIVTVPVGATAEIDTVAGGGVSVEVIDAGTDPVTLARDGTTFTVTEGAPLRWPTQRSHCFANGWRRYAVPEPFRNQGQCVSWLMTQRTPERAAS